MLKYIGEERLKTIAELTKDEFDKNKISYSYANNKLTISGGFGGGTPTPSMHNYSTEEQVIGTWIDGKPIYERVFDVNVTVAGNEVWFPVVTIDNIKWCLDIKLYYDTGMRGNYEEMSVSNNYVQVWCSNSCAGRNIRQVIVQYTKTTD